jgi:signal transduction histidine kinase
MRRWWKLGALVALGGLAVFDVGTGVLASPGAYPWLGFAALVCSLLPVVAWLWPQPVLAVPAAVASLVLTFTHPASQTNWGLVETAGLFGVLLVVVWRARSWWQAPVVLIVLAAIVTQPLEGRRWGEEEVIFGLVLLVIAMGVIAAVGYVRLVEAARARQVVAVRAEQKAEFARDLHDFVAHHVTGIVVLAQGAQRVLERNPAAAARALSKIEHAGGEAMTAMRRMVGVLREDQPLAPLGGIAELAGLVEDFGAPEARLRVEGPVEDLPVEVTSSVYRVVMEALTNVRRHALEATAVDVSVLSSEDWVTVRVTNDGRAAKGDGKGFGLLGLTERVQALGGRIKAGPGINGGWVVDAALPRVGA